MPEAEFRELSDTLLRRAMTCVQVGPQASHTLSQRFADSIRSLIEGVEDRTATEVATALNHGSK